MHIKLDLQANVLLAITILRSIGIKESLSKTVCVNCEFYSLLTRYDGQIKQ